MRELKELDALRTLRDCLMPFYVEMTEQRMLEWVGAPKPRPSGRTELKVMLSRIGYDHLALASNEFCPLTLN